MQVYVYVCVCVLHSICNFLGIFNEQKNMRKDGQMMLILFPLEWRDFCCFVYFAIHNFASISSFLPSSTSSGFHSINLTITLPMTSADLVMFHMFIVEQRYTPKKMLTWMKCNLYQLHRAGLYNPTVEFVQSVQFVQALWVKRNHRSWNCLNGF